MWSNSEPREVGVPRLALGASPKRVQGMILRQVLALATVGVLFGFALAVALGSALSTMVFDVSPLDPTTVAGRRHAPDNRRSLSDL
jgi:ABC-type antimicrobial peptide transport system permease subunit